jgi:transcriptional regulator with XRE-family HTH domain
MSTIVVTAHLAARLKAERETRGWSIAELAERSGVSRAMISKAERAEVSPTAELLGRMSGALGLSLSQLLAGVEPDRRMLARRDEQTLWTDPVTGYVRRAVSPPGGEPLELVEVELPAQARVNYSAAAYRFLHLQIWVLHGTLEFTEGATRHRLEQGDCLQLGPPADCAFHNPEGVPCRYLVALLLKHDRSPDPALGLGRRHDGSPRGPAF